MGRRGNEIMRKRKNMMLRGGRREDLQFTNFFRLMGISIRFITARYVPGSENSHPGVSY
jgi:hypothetical protein